MAKSDIGVSPNFKEVNRLVDLPIGRRLAVLRAGPLRSKQAYHEIRVYGRGIGLPAHYPFGLPS